MPRQRCVIISVRSCSEDAASEYPYLRVARSPENTGKIRVMDVPDLVVFVVIDPKTKADQEKLGQALQKLMAEDPTFRVNTDTRTSHAIIRGTGELHLEVIVGRLTREFNVAATIGKPQVRIAKRSDRWPSTITRTRSRPADRASTLA